MAKYVCDVEQVTAIGEKVVQTVGELETSVNSYSSRIESDLNGWSGESKTSFNATNAEQVKQATTDLSYVKELGEFIKSAAKSIQELEEQLATLSI